MRRPRLSRRTVLAALVTSGSLITSCAHRVDYWAPPGGPPKVEKTDRVVVIPPNVAIRGNERQLSLLAEEMFIAQLKHSAKPLGGEKIRSKLKAAELGDISRHLPNGMKQAAFVTNDGMFSGEYADLNNRMVLLFRLIHEVFRPPLHYVAVFHVVELPQKQQGHIELEVRAGLYDVKRNAIASAVVFKRAIKETDLAVTMREIGVDAAREIMRAPKEEKLEAPPDPQAPEIDERLRRR